MGRTAPLISAVTLALLAAGITPVRAQDDSTPAGQPAADSGPSIIEQYREVVRSLTPGDEDVELSLTLREATSMALRNNLELQVSSYGPSISRATLTESESAFDTLFTQSFTGGESKQPVVVTLAGDVDQLESDTFNTNTGLFRRLTTGATVNFGVSTDRTLSNAGFAALNRRYQSNVGLQLRQPLLRGAGTEYNEAGIRFSEDQVDVADITLRSDTEALVRDVEFTYWRLVNSLGQVMVQRRSLEVARDLARIADARLESGAGTRVDVSQAGAGVALREVDLLKAENAARTAQESLLGLLMSRTPGHSMSRTMRVVPADDPQVMIPPLPVEDLETGVEQALLDRSDLEILRLRVSQSELTVMRAESDSLVRLDFTGAVSYAGLDGGYSKSFSESMASRRYPSYSIGLYLEVPLGNRAARSRLERAVLQRSQAEARVRAKESEIAVRVRNARRDLESARREIDAALRAVSLSEEQLEAERERLRLDKSTTFNVLNLEEDLTAAQTSFIEALVGYRSAMAGYDFERGRILERRGLTPPESPRSSGTDDAENAQ